MKYSVKVNIDKQENANAGLKDASGSALPPKIETFTAYTAVTDVVTPRISGSVSGSVSGSDTKYTASQIKAEVFKYYVYTTSSLVSEKLYTSKGVEITGTGSVEESNLIYIATFAPFTGSVASGSTHTGSVNL